MNSTNSSGRLKAALRDNPSSDLTLLLQAARISELEHVALCLADQWKRAEAAQAQARETIARDYEQETADCRAYRDLENKLTDEEKELLCEHMTPEFQSALVDFDDGTLGPEPVPTMWEALEQTDFFDLMRDLVRQLEKINESKTNEEG